MRGKILTLRTISEVSHRSLTTSILNQTVPFKTTRAFSVASPDEVIECLTDNNEESWVDSFCNVEFQLLKDSILLPKYSAANVDDGKRRCDAATIAQIVANCDDVFGHETQKVLRQYRSKLNDSLVQQVLGIVKNPERGVKFFIWAGSQIGYSHTLPVYDALLALIESGDNGCGVDRSMKGTIPDAFLQEIRGDDKEVFGKLLNVLIQRRCRGGQWNMALLELGRLKDFGYKPMRWTYNALIHVFLRAERFDSAHLVHEEMNGLGYKMDKITLGFFAHSLCKVGKWREALLLIEKEEFTPDTVLYTQMISGLCESSLFDEAMNILNRMRVSSCLPNVVTYRTLLCGCLRKKKLGRCKRILSIMITEGCYPSRGIFNSLVDAYCKAQDYSYAYKLLKKTTTCGYQPGYVLYNIFIGAICGNDNLPGADEMTLAEKVFSEMLEAGVVLNKLNLSNYARCLCAFGKADIAYKAVQEMMNKGFAPDLGTYANVIGYLCNVSRVEEAFLLFQQMKKHEIAPDVYTYTMLIDSFCKVGLIDQARRWLDEMEQEECSPNVVTYTALIHGYLKAGKLLEANVIFEMMLTKECIPNVVTYTALIDGLCKAGKTEAACQVYAKMKENNIELPNIDMYFGVSHSESIEPNVFTYGALVDGLCKANKVKEAYDMLEAMSKVNCKPNNIIYDSLIDGFCKAGQLAEAQDVLTKMLGHGYSPNVYTFSSLIDRMFKEKRLDLVLKVVSKMIGNSCSPNVVIYTEMIDGLCKLGKINEASKLMTMMEEKECNPNVVTYTAIIDGFGKAGRIDKCFELFKQMLGKGCAPNHVTYNVLINHCCSAGLLDEAHKLLEQMKQTYWPTQTISYRKVIEGFNREFLVSHDLLVNISESNSVPVLPTYKILIDNFVKAGRLNNAVELLMELSPERPISLGQQNLYLSLVFSLSLANKVERAVEVYSTMVNKGGIPEVSTLVHLVESLLNHKKWEEAMQLVYCLSQMGIQWV